MQGGRADLQPVRRLGDVAAEAAELGGERGEPVGLVAADVRHPADPGRARGQRGEGGDGRGELAGVVQVDVDAGQRRRAR